MYELKNGKVINLTEYELVNIKVIVVEKNTRGRESIELEYSDLDKVIGLHKGALYTSLLRVLGELQVVRTEEEIEKALCNLVKAKTRGY